MLFLTLTDATSGGPVEVVFETIGALRHPTATEPTKVYTTVGVFEVREPPEAIQARVTETAKQIQARRALLGAANGAGASPATH